MFGNELDAAVAAAGRCSGSEIFAHLYVDQSMFTAVWGWRQDIKKLPKSLSDAKRRNHPNKGRLEEAFNARLQINNGEGNCRDKLNALLKELNSAFGSIECSCGYVLEKEEGPFMRRQTQLSRFEGRSSTNG